MCVCVCVCVYYIEQQQKKFKRYIVNIFHPGMDREEKQKQKP